MNKRQLEIIKGIHDVLDEVGNDAQEKAEDDHGLDHVEAGSDPTPEEIRELVSEFGPLGPGGRALADTVGVDHEVIDELADFRADRSMSHFMGVVKQAGTETSYEGQPAAAMDANRLHSLFAVTYLDGFFAGAAWAKDKTND